MYPTLTLKANKLTSVQHNHPWIFSGALKEKPASFPHGGLVRVAGPDGAILGVGTCSAKSMIAVRLFAFEDVELNHVWLMRKIREANERRILLGYGPGSGTTGYRVVFGESDSLPGLIVDRYEDVLVFQLATAGLDAMREMLVETLVELFGPRAIAERSDLSVRSEEGLDPVTAVRHGDDPGEVRFTENGLTFSADLLRGQKTGFFLDQKDLRAQIRALAKGRRVLNLFSYTGSCSVAALAGGAVSVQQVDSSEPALAQTAQQLSLNGLPTDSVTNECSDVFQWLNAHAEPSFDMVILDPPALIKSQKDLENGRKAYHFLNRAAMRVIVDGGLLVSSSCSQFFTEEDLLMTLRKGSVQAKADLKLFRVVRQAPDHPISLYFPESGYLKSAIAQIGR